jgi:hypothetical protein
MDSTFVKTQTARAFSGAALPQRILRLASVHINNAAIRL